MGTRNLTCIYADGEYKVAQYGQWDGYPDAGGAGILEALKATTPEELKEKAARCYEASEKEVKQKWIECGSDGGEFASMEVSDKMKEIYPTLQRDMGWGIVKHLVENNAKQFPIQKNLEFAKDSLFCEWCYVVDLDSGTFEIYKGFNTEKCEGRFADMYNDGEYHPVALVKTYKLDDLPNESVFLKYFEELEEAQV